MMNLKEFKRVKIKVIFIFFISFFLWHCNEKPQAIEEKTEEKAQTLITPKAIENFSFKDYALSNESIQLVSAWPKYQELENQINYLRKADVSFFSGDLKVLKDFITEFKKEIPKSIETNAIISRVATIETMLLKLHDNFTLNGIADKIKLENIKAVLVAFANLNYQINKKLEMDLYNQIQPE